MRRFAVCVNSRDEFVPPRWYNCAGDGRWVAGAARIRQAEGAHGTEDAESKETVMADDRPEKIVAALGGTANIVEIEGCITRLRCELKDGSVIDEPALK